jgi:5-methylcytosine-specific restriction endonuclease McrA
MGIRKFVGIVKQKLSELNGGNNQVRSEAVTVCQNCGGEKQPWEEETIDGLGGVL